MSRSRMLPGRPGSVGDLTGAIPNLTGAIPDLPGSVRDLKFVKNARSGMLPAQPGSVPDLKTRGPEHCQVDLAVFQTSNLEVRNTARSTWQHSGPQHGSVSDLSGGQYRAVDPNRIISKKWIIF